jgi:hypothetical protein
VTSTGSAAADTEPTTRAGIARRAIREFALGLVGWSVGAAILWFFGRGTVDADLGLLVLAIAAFVGVVVLLTAALERRRPRFGSRTRPYDVRWGVSSLLLCVTLPAALRATAASHLRTPLELWFAVLALLPIAWAIEFGPRLVWPQGRATLPRPRSSRVAPVVLGGLLLAGIGAWLAANTLLADGRVVSFSCDSSVPADVCAAFQPTLPAIPDPTWILIGALGAGAFVAWWVGLTQACYWLIAAPYIGLVLWSEQVWSQIQEGSLIVGAAGDPLLRLQIAAGALLLAGLPVASFFRRDAWRAAPEIAGRSSVVERSLDESTPRFRWSSRD